MRHSHKVSGVRHSYEVSSVRLLQSGHKGLLQGDLKQGEVNAKTK